jgi:hypothetical protein
MWPDGKFHAFCRKYCLHLQGFWYCGSMVIRNTSSHQIILYCIALYFNIQYWCIQSLDNSINNIHNTKQHDINAARRLTPENIATAVRTSHFVLRYVQHTRGFHYNIQTIKHKQLTQTLQTLASNWYSSQHQTNSTHTSTPHHTRHHAQAAPQINKSRQDITVTTTDGAQTCIAAR